MAAEEFDPVDNARPPREEGWKEETEEVFEAIKNRGDLRIGQAIINAVSDEVNYPERPEEKKITELNDEEVKEHIEKLRQHQEKRKAAIERKIWSIEADELAELLDNYIGESQ